MKKLLYISMIMFAMVMVTSCEKEDVEPNEPIDTTNPNGGLITLAQLNGTWNFVKYIYNGVDYNHDNALNGMDYVFGTYNFNTTNMTWDSGSDFLYSFKKDENYIEIWRGNDPPYMKYTVVGFSGNELRLRLDFVPTMWQYNYLGGTLVFNKQ